MTTTKQIEKHIADTGFIYTLTSEQNEGTKIVTYIERSKKGTALLKSDVVSSTGEVWDGTVCLEIPYSEISKMQKYAQEICDKMPIQLKDKWEIDPDFIEIKDANKK